MKIPFHLFQRRKYSFTTIFLLLFATCFSVPSLFSQYLSTEDQLRHYVEYLAADELKGRIAGTKEGWEASGYIHDELQKSGLKPLYDNGYQGFAKREKSKRISRFVVEYENITSSSDEDAASFYKYATHDTSITAPVVFVGFGRNGSGSGFSSDTIHDYRNVDVRGKWVMTFLSNNYTGNVNFAESGCVGVIYIMEDSSGTFNRKVRKIDSSFRFLSFHDLNEFGLTSKNSFVKKNELYSIALSTGFAKKILAKNGLEYEETFIRAIRENVSCDLQGTFTYTIEIENNTKHYRNVAFVLEGNDPRLKNEYIVIGAHHDHIGKGPQTNQREEKYGDDIFNGADDNASGCAVLLTLAHRLNEQKSSLKRSIIFVTFDFEEGGLHGSRFFVNHLPDGIKTDQIKTMVNLDMVGRLTSEEKLTIRDIGSAENGEKIIKKIVKKTDIPFKLNNRVSMNSDHYNFFRKGIPVVMITTGLHEDYHKVSDEADKINYAGMVSITDFCYRLLLYLNDKPLKPVKKQPAFSIF